MQKPSSSGFDFWGGVSNVTNGISDTFNVLLDGALKFENFKSQRDASGQSQGEVITAVTRPSNTNAQPISAAQYNDVATGQQQKAPSASGASNQNMLIAAAIVGVLILALR